MIPWILFNTVLGCIWQSETKSESPAMIPAPSPTRSVYSRAPPIKRPKKSKVKKLNPAKESGLLKNINNELKKND